MKIIVNGEGKECAARTLKDLLIELGFGDAKLATAVNESFVPASGRGSKDLDPGDRIEIVAPQQGG